MKRYLVLFNGKIEGEFDRKRLADELAHEIIEELSLDARRAGEWIGDESVHVVEVLTAWKVEPCRDDDSNEHSDPVFWEMDASGIWHRTPVHGGKTNK